MLKKDSVLRWNVEAKQSFDSIKQVLTKTPVLISPDFKKDFMIFSFVSEKPLLQFYYRKMTKDLNNL